MSIHEIAATIYKPINTQESTLNDFSTQRLPPIASILALLETNPHSDRQPTGCTDQQLMSKIEALECQLCKDNRTILAPKEGLKSSNKTLGSLHQMLDSAIQTRNHPQLQPPQPNNTCAVFPLFDQNPHSRAQLLQPQHGTMTGTVPFQDTNGNENSQYCEFCASYDPTNYPPSSVMQQGSHYRAGSEINPSDPRTMNNRMIPLSEKKRPYSTTFSGPNLPPVQKRKRINDNLHSGFNEHSNHHLKKSGNSYPVQAYASQKMNNLEGYPYINSNQPSSSQNGDIGKMIESSNTQVRWGYDCLQRNDYERAQVHMEIAIALNDHNAEAHAGLSEAWRMKGDFSKSLEAASDALILQPLNIIALINKAIALSYLNQKEESTAIYEFVLQMQPSNRFALTGKVINLFELNRIPECSTAIHFALGWHPEDETALKYSDAIKRNYHPIPYGKNYL